MVQSNNEEKNPLNLAQNLYFNSDVKIKSSYNESSQGKVYFGNEKTTGIKVVIKEYAQSNYRDFLRESYILSKIER